MMKKDKYYNRPLSEIYDLKDKAFNKITNEIPIELLGISLSLGLQKPFNILFSIPLIIDCSRNFINNRFFIKNFNDLYRNSLEYQDVYKIYSIILEELSNFFKSQELDNEMKIFASYYHMLRKGFLSIEHQFYFSTNIDVELFLYGANIMEGRGKCLNISSMFTDLLRVMNYDAWNLSMALTDKKIFPLNDNYLDKESNRLVNKIKDKDGVKLETIEDLVNINHVATLVRDNNHSYVIDPTNNTLFLVDFDKNVKHDKNYYYVEYLKGFNRDINNSLNELLLSTNYKLLSALINDYNNQTMLCEEMTDLFEKFYLEHKCLYEEVASKKKVLIRENRFNNN